MKEIAEVVAEVLVAQIQEQNIDVFESIPKVLVRRGAARRCAFSARHGVIVEAARLIPQERIQQCIVEEIVEIVAPQIQEHAVDVFKVTPQEWVPERMEACGPQSRIHRD